MPVPSTPVQPTPPATAGARAARRPRPPRLLLALAGCALALALAPAALLPAASAQDLGHKAPPQSRPVLINNATVHTGVGGQVHAPGYIVFENGRITAVGAEPAPRVTDAVRVVDGTGLHVYPGLISPVTQLGLTELAAVRASNDMREVGTIKPEVVANLSVNPDSTLIPVARSNGILTVGVFPSGGLVSGRASVLSLDGWTWEDMTVLADAGVAMNWPITRTFSEWWMTRSEDEQRRDTRRATDDLENMVHTARAYYTARAADPDATPADLSWEAMRPVLGEPAHGDTPAKPPSRPLFVFANDIDQIQQAVAFGAAHGLKVVIVGGRDADRCADLLKEHSVPVIVVGVHNMPRRADSPYDEAFTLPARLHAAGIQWALASGEETPHERSLPYHAATAVAFGLPREAAIAAMTSGAARALGVGDELGTLATGKRATIILTTGDPLEITTRTRHAFIDGREIDLSNKQTALNDKYRERYRQMGQLTPTTPAGAPDSERANTPGTPGTPAATRPNQGTPAQNPAQQPPATAPAQRQR